MQRTTDRRKIRPVLRIRPVVTAVTAAVFAAGGLSVAGASAATGVPGVTSPGAAVSAGAPAAAPATAPSLVTAEPMPKDCGVLTTMASGRTLKFGIIDRLASESVDAGLTLDFEPRALTYVVSSTNRGITARRLLATAPDGGLHLITLLDRVNPTTKKVVTTSTVTRIGSGWGDVRLLVSSYPYVYGVNDAGALKRYQMTKTWGITGAGTIRRTGWSSVVSLSRGDLWNLGKDARGRARYADDIVGLLSDGSLRAYLVPRDAYQAVSAFTLVPKGWHIYRHVSIGACDVGKSRPIIGITPDGRVQAYVDRNGDDQRGSDIRWAGLVAKEWTGVLAD